MGRASITSTHFWHMCRMFGSVSNHVTKFHSSSMRVHSTKQLLCEAWVILEDWLFGVNLIFFTCGPAVS